jgi:hypothetical protein
LINDSNKCSVQLILIILRQNMHLVQQPKTSSRANGNNNVSIQIYYALPNEVKEQYYMTNDQSAYE